jgi:hypothetical protein
VTVDRQPPQSDRPVPRFTEVDPFRAALDRVGPPRSPQLPQFEPPPRSPAPPPPPSDRRISEAPTARPVPPPPPPLDHWSRPAAARPAPRPLPGPAGRPARSPRVARSGGRRRSPITLRQVLAWGDRLFRGKLLFWLFGAWALLWLLGGVAMVGLITIDRRPLVPEAPAIAPAPRAERPPAPARQAAVFADDTPMAGQGQGRDRAPITPTIPASRPPVALFAGAAVLCGLGSWVRLRQIQTPRSPGGRPPHHRLPR